MLTWSDSLVSQLALLATIDPQSLAASATLTSDVVDTQDVRQQVMVVVLVGVVSDGASLTVELEQSDASSGAFESLEPARKIEQITSAGTQYVLSLDVDDVSSGKRFIRARVTEMAGGVASATIALLLLGTAAAHLPAGNLSSVVVNR